MTEEKKVDIDALMDAIVKDDEPESPAAAPDETGEEEAQEAPPEGEGGEEAHDEGEEPGPAPEARERSGEAEKALKAAKVAGMPESMLSAATDEELIGWHQSKLRNDADVRRTFQENAELRQRLETLEGAKAPEREAAPADAKDFVPKELAELLGDDEARALAQWQQTRESALHQEIAAIRETLAEEMLEGVWSQLTTEGLIGQELPEGARETVLQEAAMQVKTGKYDALKGKARLRALLTDSARIALPAPAAGAVQESPPAPERSRGTNGTVKPAPSRKPPTRKPSTKEAVDTALDLIVDRGERDIQRVRREIAG